MPPPQRTQRRPPRSPAPPYRKRRRISSDDHRRSGWAHINDTLPDDALAAIFARLPSPADAVRCAATCARWRRVVASRAAALARSLPTHLVGRFLPHLAVGFFHLDRDGPTARTRSVPGAPPQPRFLATASGRRLLLHLPGLGRCQKPSIGDLLLDGRAAMSLDYSRPVASRGGRLVLELRRDRGADAITLCVCRPLTGRGRDIVVLPPLPYKPITGDYGCAILTGDDDLPPRRRSDFFQLILLYNLRPYQGRAQDFDHGPAPSSHSFTALRCYSSDTGRWGPEARSPVNVSTRELRHIGPAAVLHGAAFWPLDHGALGVRPTAADEPEVHLLPYEVPNCRPETRLLGVSPDNRLFFIYFGFFINGDKYSLIAKISYFHIHEGDIKTGRESSSKQKGIQMHHMKMTCLDNKLKLRWIGDKSGVVVFTIGGDGGCTGAFALNTREGTVDKLAGDEGHTWGNVIGFEMDWAAYLASQIALVKS